MLVQRDEAIELLALFDAPHPKFREQLSPAELEVVRKTYLADRKKKYLDNLRHGRFDHLVADATSFAWGKLKPVAWRVQTTVQRALKRQRSAVSKSLRTEAMWRAYSPKTFPGRLILFRAEGRDAEFAEDPTMGWRKAVAGTVDVQFATGTHEEMMDEVHAQRLATLLSPYLDSAILSRDD
jgi:thioesterase domain-containing protein